MSVCVSISVWSLLIVYLSPILQHIGVFARWDALMNQNRLHYILFYFVFSYKYFEHVRALRLNCKPNHHKFIEYVTVDEEHYGTRDGYMNSIATSEKYYLMLIIESKY